MSRPAGHNGHAGQVCRECQEFRPLRFFAENTHHYRRKDGTVSVTRHRRKVCNGCRSAATSIKAQIQRESERNRKLMALISWPPPRAI